MIGDFEVTYSCYVFLIYTTLNVTPLYEIWRWCLTFGAGTQLLVPAVLFWEGACGVIDRLIRRFTNRLITHHTITLHLHT